MDSLRKIAEKTTGEPFRSVVNLKIVPGSSDREVDQHGKIARNLVCHRFDHRLVLGWFDGIGSR